MTPSVLRARGRFSIRKEGDTSQEVDSGASASARLGWSLMKIPRIPAYSLQPCRAIVQALRDHVRDAITPLQRTFDHQQARFECAAALGREYLRPQNDIDDAGLIFQRREHYARGGRRLLHVRNQPPDPHAAAIGELLQIAAAAKSLARERRAQQRQRMTAGGQSQMPIVGEDILALG